jgi:flagellar hook assembly protein FlgD
MKDLEKIFKDSLSNHQVPYDASAWSALSSKMAVNQKPFFKKSWFFGAVACIVVALSSITYYVNSNDQALPDNMVTREAEAKSNNNYNKVEQTPSLKVRSKENDSKIENASIPQESAVKRTVNESFKGNSGMAIIEVNEELKEDLSSFKESSKKSEIVKIEEVNVPLNANFQISEVSVCSGVSFTIKLPVQEMGVSEKLTIDNVTIPLRSRTVEYKVLKAGRYDITYSLNNASSEKVSNSKQVTIVEAEQADFQYSTTTEKGMPLTHFTSNNNNVVWKIDGKLVSNSSTFKYLFMNKGSYEVSMETKNENGCGTIATKTIHIESDYKLFAETGLILSSTDPRLNSFMPFALEEMDTPDFLLSVLDARTGEVLFTSNDVSFKWDGTKRDGNKLEPGSIVFWTVIINGNKYINKPIKGDITIKD